MSRYALWRTLACTAALLGVLYPALASKAIASWELLYAHDSKGNRTSGHITELVNAVETGKPVRIVVEHGNYQHITRAEQLWVKNEIVYAQTSNAWCVRWEADSLKLQGDSCYWEMIVNTLGEVDRIEVHGAVQKALDHQRDRAAIKWFAGD